MKGRHRCALLSRPKLSHFGRPLDEIVRRATAISITVKRRPLAQLILKAGACGMNGQRNETWPAMPGSSY
jgi:hypothetical protein